VHGGPAARDALQGADELVAVEHALLEEVADTAGAVGQELPGVQLLDVLGEDEYRQPWHLAAGGDGRAQSLVRPGRWHADVDARPIRAPRPQRVERLGSGGRGRHHLVPVRLDQTDHPVAQEVEVFGYDDSHGTAILTRVGPPGGLAISRVPSKTARRRR